MPTKNPKNQLTTFRFDPASKAALALIADREGRSMANTLEWLIRKHCQAEGFGWPPVVSEDAALPTKSSDAHRKKRD
jgi:hypothetical protein